MADAAFILAGEWMIKSAPAPDKPGKMPKMPKVS
jgi:hypothetical protein